MFSEVTFDQIESLIVSSDVQGRKIYVTFALPGSDEVVEAEANISRTNTVAGQVGRQFKRQAVNEVRRGLGRMLRGILGGGMLGRTARTVVNTATRETSRNVVNLPSKKDKQEAIVAAFRQVSGHFQWDAGSGQWVSGSGTGSGSAAANAEPTPFELQLQKAPVSSKFEKDVLARILAHAAQADGELSEEEAEFFADSIPPEFGTLKDLAGSEKVSAIEAEEIPSSVRETIYMLAWTISSVDMETSPAEVQMLESVGQTFGLSDVRAKELADIARIHVLEGYFHEDISRTEVHEMGANLGLSNDDAERAKIRWMKRQ